MDDKTLQRFSRMEGVVVLLSLIRFPLARNKVLHIFASEKYKEHDHISEETSHVLIDGRKQLALGVRS